ncbi:MAG: VWA domain-containing protein [bacterium]|nr:VWA domain-containing protein [Gammaproteobacteria bacterium]
MVQVNDKKKLVSSNSDVSSFLAKVARTPVITSANKPGRLVFALDATLSRSPTWDTASQLQAQMFSETADIGGLEIQLCYYRGFNEFYASQWHRNTAALLRDMTGVRCLGGHTQIARVLRHGLAESRSERIQALVFVGDAMEEKADDLCNLAGQLGVMNIPVFIFQEGGDAKVEQTFRQISRLSGGAYAPFDLNSAHQLKELLGAVAVYAAGGRPALENFSRKKGSDVKLLTQQLTQQRKG